MSTHVRKSIPDFMMHHSKEEEGIRFQDYVRREHRGELPLNHSYNMSSVESPDDSRRHESAFTRMQYTADSKYRWKKIQGNLDLFVMERNERHLTSLQYKWQKMSRTKKRFSERESGHETGSEMTTTMIKEYEHDNRLPPPTPDDGGGMSNEAYRDDITEASRVRSRGQSRQKMQEDLEAHFYERWKMADDRHNCESREQKSSSKMTAPSFLSRTPQSEKRHRRERQRHFFENSARFKYPQEHLSTYPRQGANINFVYSPEYDTKSSHELAHFHQHLPTDVLYQNYPPYHPNSQHQGRFDYHDPWLTKKQAFYEPNVSEKSALVRTTNRLLRQQNETEKQLQDLRQLLKVELDEQDESCERDERTQDRIDELEKQINSMDNKLERINLEITESRVNSQNMMSLDSGTPGTPLFIIDTPHRNSHEISKFAIPYEEEDENRDYYGGVDDDEQTSAYDTLDHVESVLEETKMQQEDLKNELQTQMMNMRAELEKQLAMQMTVTTTNETNVNDEEMDARVTYLEKQIEDMQKKIKVADEVIADTEVKKQKIQRKKKASAHKKAAKTLSKSSENSKSAKESIRNATSPAHKRLISKTSSKVSPAPNRKTSTNVASSLRTSTHDRKSHKSSETHGSIKTSTNKSSHKSEIHQSPASSASTSEKQQTLSVSTTAKTKSKPSQSTHVTLESRKSSKRTESTAKSKSHKTLSKASSKKIQSVSTLSHAKEMEKSSTSGESSGKESKLILNDCDEDQAEEMASQILDDMSTFEEVQLETVEGDGEPEETAAAKAMRDFKAFFNFNFKPFEKFKRKKRRKSVLHGLGTNWCVCPNAMWKYLGDEQDEEIVTRRKCISLILGIILIILLLAIVGSLAIGLSGSEPPEKPTESPLQFTVINADEEG